MQPPPPSHRLFLRPFLLALIPALLVCIDIALHGINIPDGDEWLASLPIALKTDSGTLSLADLFAPHNEHRVFFTNAITALSTLTTRWNLKLEMYLTVILAGVLAVTLVAVLYPIARSRLTITAVAVSFLVFSIRSRYTWLLSFQTSFVLAALFLTLGLLGIQHGARSWRTFAIAVVCSTCATFCMLAGLLAWPLLFVALLLHGYRRSILLAWVLAGACTVALFFTNYTIQDFGARYLPSFATTVVAFPLYIADYLASPFLPERAESLVPALLLTTVGFVALVLNLRLRWRLTRQWRDLTPFIVLTGFSFGSAILTSAGRLYLFVGGDLAQPLAQRYVIHATLGWAALVVLILQNTPLIARAFPRNSARRGIFVLNGALLPALAILYIVASVSVLLGSLPQPSQALNCGVDYWMLHGRVSCFVPPYVPVFNMQAAVDALYAHRLSLFAGYK